MTKTCRLQDDLYTYVNQDWLEKTEIPADKPSISSFHELAEEIDEKLLHDLDLLVEKLPTLGKSPMRECVAYYQLASDQELREKLGVSPLLPYLEKVEKLQSLDDLVQQLPEWILSGMPVPFQLFVDTDMKEAQYYTLYAGAPALILPDKTYYEADNPSKEALLQVFDHMSCELLQAVGKTQEEAKELLGLAREFDRKIAPYTLSSEEAADVKRIYNPREIDTVDQYSQSMSFKQLITTLVGQTPKEIIVMEPAYYEQFQQLVNPTTFKEVKAWLYLNTLRSFTNFLTEDIRQIAFQYSQALSGSKEMTASKKQAFYLASGTFDQVLGEYYGQKYFGQEAKKNVEDMVMRMIGVYKQRLKKNSWLQQATKEKAVTKLETLGIQVGYPSKMAPIYEQTQVTSKENGGNLVSNAQRFTNQVLTYQFKLFGQQVDRDLWEMGAHVVNAYYHPQLNVIVFPAAILQAPFYDLEQHPSANYGGIGAVIAHEISHAFDNNGALFDEKGNMNNWWTPADYETFEQLAEEMVTQFQGLPVGEKQVNGRLTVSENIADAGGLSCALEAAKTEQDVDLEAFFINWARVWRQKSSKEYQELLIAIDVHSPNYWRANKQPQNLPEFYDTFQVSREDHMYLSPDKRVTIW